MTKKVLMTGFEPFGGESVNAAWEAVRTFEGQSVAGAQVVVKQLPTVYGDAPKVLLETMRDVEPDIVLCVGEAGGRSAISIERIGVNLNHARIPDNAGNQPMETPAIPDAPAAYWSKLPVADLVHHLKEIGLPAEESFTAGTFVCNHILFHLLHALAGEPYRDRQVIGGFIHVPYVPSQAARHNNSACLSSDVVRQGLEEIIKVLVNR